MLFTIGYGTGAFGAPVPPPLQKKNPGSASAHCTQSTAQRVTIRNNGILFNFLKSFVLY